MGKAAETRNDRVVAPGVIGETGPVWIDACSPSPASGVEIREIERKVIGETSIDDDRYERNHGTDQDRRDDPFLKRPSLETQR